MLFWIYLCAVLEYSNMSKPSYIKNAILVQSVCVPKYYMPCIYGLVVKPVIWDWVFGYLWNEAATACCHNNHAFIFLAAVACIPAVPEKFYPLPEISPLPLCIYNYILLDPITTQYIIYRYLNFMWVSIWITQTKNCMDALSKLTCYQLLWM